MKTIALAFLPKKRNNSPTNLAFGLASGFDTVGIPWRRVDLVASRSIDPEQVAGCDALVVPYWIHRDLFSVNFAHLRHALGPHFPIATYTGVGPYWEGCPWVTLRRRGSEWMQEPGFEATSSEADALRAISTFAVVAHRDQAGVPPNEHAVGMGRHAGLAPGDKYEFPVVVLDFFKPGWDERVFDDAVRGLALAREEYPDLQVMVLGRKSHDRALQVDSRAADWCVVVEDTYTEFEHMAEIYRGAWAMVVHNESFGFPAHEAAACGTQIMRAMAAEVPDMYGEFTTSWSTPADLAQRVLKTARATDVHGLSVEMAQRWKDCARRHALDDWGATATRVYNILFSGSSRLA